MSILGSSYQSEESLKEELAELRQGLEDEGRSLEAAQKKLKALEDYVTKNYKAAHGAYTPERSFGNADDVFQDGGDQMQAQVLWDIAQILGMKVEQLKAPPDPDW